MNNNTLKIIKIENNRKINMNTKEIIYYNKNLNKNKICYLLDLPNEIIIKILEYTIKNKNDLLKFMLINKKFYNILTSNYISFNFICHNNDQEIIKKYKNINFSVGSEKINNSGFNDDIFDNYELAIGSLEFEQLDIEKINSLYNLIDLTIPYDNYNYKNENKKIIKNINRVNIDFYKNIPVIFPVPAMNVSTLCIHDSLIFDYNFLKHSKIHTLELLYMQFNDYIYSTFEGNTIRKLIMYNCSINNNIQFENNLYDSDSDSDDDEVINSFNSEVAFPKLEELKICYSFNIKINNNYFPNLKKFEFFEDTNYGYIDIDYNTLPSNLNYLSIFNSREIIDLSVLQHINTISFDNIMVDDSLCYSMYTNIPSDNTIKTKNLYLHRVDFNNIFNNIKNVIITEPYDEFLIENSKNFSKIKNLTFIYNYSLPYHNEFIINIIDYDYFVNKN